MDQLQTLSIRVLSMEVVDDVPQCVDTASMATKLVHDVQISSVHVVAIERLDGLMNAFRAYSSSQELHIEFLHLLQL